MENTREANNLDAEIAELEARLARLDYLIEHKPGTEFMHEGFVKDRAEIEVRLAQLKGSEELEEAA